MPTVAEVQSALRARAEANFTAAPLRFKNEGTALPVDGGGAPAGFVYVELLVENAGIVAFGGGRGSNLQRSIGRIEAHVLTPVGYGLDTGLGWAEQFCAVFRGQRVDNINYGAAEVFPQDGKTEDGSYAHIATAIIDLSFDKAA